MDHQPLLVDQFTLLVNSLMVHFSHMYFGPSVMLVLFDKKAHVDFDVSSKIETNNKHGQSIYILK